MKSVGKRASVSNSVNRSQRLFYPAIFLFVVVVVYASFVPFPTFSQGDLTESIQVLFQEQPLEQVNDENEVSLTLPQIADVDEVKKTFFSQVTVYHSLPHETSGDPFITALGTRTRDGVLASNCLAFGTRVRLPELFGERVFVVEDRLAAGKTCFVLDVWREYNPNNPSFGAPVTKVEILYRSPLQSFAWL